MQIIGEIIQWIRESDRKCIDYDRGDSMLVTGYFTVQADDGHDL